MSRAECIVCGKELGAGRTGAARISKDRDEETCPRCGFPKRIPEFLSAAQYQEWLREVAEPWKKRFREEEERKNPVSEGERLAIIRRECAAGTRRLFSRRADRMISELLREIESAWEESFRGMRDAAQREFVRKCGGNFQNPALLSGWRELEKTCGGVLCRAKEEAEKKRSEICRKINEALPDLNRAAEKRLQEEFPENEFWKKLKKDESRMGCEGESALLSSPETEHARSQLLEAAARIFTETMKTRRKEFRRAAEEICGAIYDEAAGRLKKELAHTEKALERQLKEQEEEKLRNKRCGELERLRRDAGFCGAFGYDFLARVRPDGGVDFTGGDILLKTEVQSWKNILAVAAGNRHLAGLCRDGTVVAAGRNEMGQCEVSAWKNIRQIAACADRTAALDQDGRVFVCGDYDYNLQDAGNWDPVTKIALAENHILGLRKDGTAVCAGSDDSGQCSAVSGWEDLVDIAAGEWHSLGLRKDGTAVAAGQGIDGECQVQDWKDGILIQAAAGLSLCFTSGGKVLLAGQDSGRKVEISNPENVANFLLSRDGKEIAVIEISDKDSR